MDVIMIQLYSTVSLWNHYKTDRLNHAQVGRSYFLFGERIQLNVKTKVEMWQVKYFLKFFIAIPN